MVAQLVIPLYTEALYIVVVLVCTRSRSSSLPNRVGFQLRYVVALGSSQKVLLLFLSCLCGVTLLLLVVDGIPSNLSGYQP